MFKARLLFSSSSPVFAVYIFFSTCLFWLRFFVVFFQWFFAHHTHTLPVLCSVHNFRTGVDPILLYLWLKTVETATKSISLMDCIVYFRSIMWPGPLGMAFSWFFPSLVSHIFCCSFVVVSIFANVSLSLNCHRQLKRSKFGTSWAEKILFVLCIPKTLDDLMINGWFKSDLNQWQNCCSLLFFSVSTLRARTFKNSYARCLWIRVGQFSIYK